MANDVKCPYCGEDQEICHDDGYGYEEGMKYSQQCGKCNKYFIYITSISFNYDAKKADCLNDAEHDFQPTAYKHSGHTRLVCTVCEEQVWRSDAEVAKMINNKPMNLEQQIEQEANKLFDEFYEASEIPVVDSRRTWNCVKLAVNKMIDENNSILQMAKLHMDDRTIMVINSRISKLQKLQDHITTRSTL